MNPPSAPTIYSHARSHVADIGIPSCVRLGGKVLKQSAHELTAMLGLPVRPGSVFRTTRSLGLPVRRVTEVNAHETLEWIASGGPDLVLSSCSQVFKSDLLALPRIGAINTCDSVVLPQ